MKKIVTLVVAALATMMSFGQEQEENTKTLSFAYDAGADIVSAYIWRGQYNGGLSFQPTLDLGWDSEHTSFRFGAWGSVGASDWMFRQLDMSDENIEAIYGCNPNTYFIPELDIYGTVNLWGATLGFTHYYYFGGSNFFSWDKVANWDEEKLENNTSTTEITIGYDFSTLDLCGLYFSWNTTIAGNDFQMDENDEFILDDNGNVKRNFSTYVEVGYSHTFEAIDLTLDGAIGFTPWANITLCTKEFVVNNLSLKLNKAWTFDACELDLFAQGSIVPCFIDKKNAYIKASGDNKMYQQMLNGVIGLGVWF